LTTIENLVLNFVVNALWQVALVTAVAAFGTWLLLRKASARYRHLVWVTALVLSVLLPLWSSQPHRHQTLQPAFLMPTVAVPTTAVPNVTRSSNATQIRAQAVNWEQRSNYTSIALNKSFKGVFACLYLLFLLHRLNKLWKAWRTTRAIRKRAFPIIGSEALQNVMNHCRTALGVSNVSILCSSSLTVPVTVSLWRPVIILPERLISDASSETLTAALGHEMAHISRRDFAWNLLYELLFLPISFHPTAALVKRRISQTRELACDEIVSESVMNPRDYARSLVSLASRASLPSRPTYTLGVNDADILEERVMKLLEENPRAGARLATVWFITTLFALALSAAAAAAFPINIKRDNSSQDKNYDAGTSLAGAWKGESSPDTTADNVLSFKRDGDGLTRTERALLIRNEGDGRGPQIVRGESEEATSISSDPNMQDAMGLPDLNLQIENSEGTPLTIVTATVKAFNLRSVQGDPGDYVIKPSITMINNTQRRITAFSLNIKNVESNFEYDTGQSGVAISPGGAFSGSLGRFVGLPGDPHYLKIKVVGVRFEDGSHWGNLVALIRSAQEPLARAGRGGPVAALPSAATTAPRTESAPAAAALGGTSGARAHVGGGGPVAALPSAVTKAPRTESAPQVRNLPYFMHGNSKMIRLGGGSLHNQAIKRVQPSLPSGASTGTIVVEVIVDEEGNVESARVTSGQPFGVVTSNDPLLKTAAIEAARQWRFKPEQVEGSPVKIIGELFFTFQ
jgi:bla regulator protein blaR1